MRGTPRPPDPPPPPLPVPRPRLLPRLSLQITAEQILREAHELREQEFKPPDQTITDPDELAAYRLRKRQEFEDTVRRVRWNVAAWTRYAAWEERQGDLRRARSVFERALEVEPTAASTWLKYAEMEMRNRAPNHARNVWDRAVTLLPRVDALWFKYVHMEQVLRNTAGARQVFERWLAFEPDHPAWAAYVRLELAAGEVARARGVYDRYVATLPSPKAFIAYARFEMVEAGDVGAARAVYEAGHAALGDDARLLLAFAQFEARAGEPERARAIYRHALDHVAKSEVGPVFDAYSAFERAAGDRSGVDAVVSAERRFEYEARVKADPTDYDAWFAYARLEEAGGDAAKVRDVYERAVAALPPASGPGDKRLWARYIYLWIYYAVYEEVDAKEPERAREVYRTALKVVPHAAFTFAKLWLLAARLEVRAKRLPAARKILGMALGMCATPKLFKGYIELELGLGAVARARALHEKWVDTFPSSAAAWTAYADLEAGQLGEAERARAVLALALARDDLDAPEAVWRAAIDLEASLGDRAAARALYDRLLDRTQAVNAWLAAAAFEAAPLPVADGAPAPPDDTPASRETAARAVYERGFAALRADAPDAKEEAAMLLDAWRAFEAAAAAAGSSAATAALAAVDAKRPQRVKRRRPVEGGGFEEYYDFVFPGEGGAAAGGAASLKLLEAAQRWKRQKQEGGG